MKKLRRKQHGHPWAWTQLSLKPTMALLSTSTLPSSSKHSQHKINSYPIINTSLIQLQDSFQTSFLYKVQQNSEKNILTARNNVQFTGECQERPPEGKAALDHGLPKATIMGVIGCRLLYILLILLIYHSYFVFYSIVMASSYVFKVVGRVPE